MDDYYIRYIDLPLTTKGMTVEDHEGVYNIYINAKLSFDTQQKALHHELRHVQRNDFNTEKNLFDAEKM